MLKLKAKGLIKNYLVKDKLASIVVQMWTKVTSVGGLSVHQAVVSFVRRCAAKRSKFFILNKEVLHKISKRAISTGQLNDSHHLHTQPIKLVVY